MQSSCVLAAAIAPCSCSRGFESHALTPCANGEMATLLAGGLRHLALLRRRLEHEVVGELLYRELLSWEEFGYRLGPRG